jgi:copper homeostasis protein
MPQALLLEICAFNIESCIIAEKTGARRIELCTNRNEGGTTPSVELIWAVKEKLSIPVYPIIRPRGGDFLYTDAEFSQMLHSIQICKELGCEGIATGVHLKNGEIDKPRFAKLVEAAYPMRVTCHRVFDRTPNPFKALEALVEIGCERILTSGQASSAIDAITLLSQLIQAADNNIIIMPGGGLRSSNIQQLIAETGAKEYHTSAIIGSTEKIDEHELKKILEIIYYQTPKK